MMPNDHEASEPGIAACWTSDRRDLETGGQTCLRGSRLIELQGFDIPARFHFSFNENSYGFDACS